jgi:hypothetical protein
MQQLIVAVLVVIAAGYAAWRLAPARQRARLAAALARWLGAHDDAPGWLRAAADALARDADARGTSACGKCSAAPTVERRATENPRR